MFDMQTCRWLCWRHTQTLALASQTVAAHCDSQYVCVLACKLTGNWDIDKNSGEHMLWSYLLPLPSTLKHTSLSTHTDTHILSLTYALPHTVNGFLSFLFLFFYFIRPSVFCCSSAIVLCYQGIYIAVMFVHTHRSIRVVITAWWLAATTNPTPTPGYPAVECCESRVSVLPPKHLKDHWVIFTIFIHCYNRCERRYKMCLKQTLVQKNTRVGSSAASCTHRVTWCRHCSNR